MIILKLKDELEKKGHTVDLFNKWKHKIKDYDLVHDFSILDWQNWDYYHHHSIPLIVTPTAWPNNNFIYLLKQNIKRYFLQITNNKRLDIQNYFRFTSWICPTTSLESKRLKDVYGKYLENKTTIIPNGVDTPNQNVSDIFRKKFNIKGDFLLSIGIQSFFS